MWLILLPFDIFEGIFWDVLWILVENWFQFFSQSISKWHFGLSASKHVSKVVWVILFITVAIFLATNFPVWTLIRFRHGHVALPWMWVSMLPWCVVIFSSTSDFSWTRTRVLVVNMFVEKYKNLCINNWEFLLSYLWKDFIFFISYLIIFTIFIRNVTKIFKLFIHWFLYIQNDV